MAVHIPKSLHRSTLRAYLSEFLGTLLLVLIGDGVVAQALLTDFRYANFLSVNLAWASAVALTCYLHCTVNPAITLSAAITRPSALAWRQIPGKMLAQFCGAFVGAAAVYLQYKSAILAWEPEVSVPGGNILSPMGHHSAGIFATYPAAQLGSNWEAAVSEFLGSAVLAFGAGAVADERNLGLGAPHFGMFVLMVGIGASMGWQTGYAINPARDFGPRLFSAIIYGREVFTTKSFYFLVPLVVPFFGCIAGAAIYDAFMFEGEGSSVKDALDSAERRQGDISLD